MHVSTQDWDLLVSLSLSLSRPPARATYLKQVFFNLAMVDGTVAPPVELDQVPVVVDKGDKVQIGIGFEGRSLRENNWAPRGGQSVRNGGRPTGFSRSTPARGQPYGAAKGRSAYIALLFRRARAGVYDGKEKSKKEDLRQFDPPGPSLHGPVRARWRSSRVERVRAESVLLRGGAVHTSLGSDWRERECMNRSVLLTGNYPLTLS